MARLLTAGRWPAALAVSVLLASLSGVGGGFMPSAAATTTSTQPTSTQISADPAEPVAGQTTTLTATVTASSGGTPPGTVQFADGGSPLGGPVALDGGDATVAATFAPGSHDLTATYAPAAGSGFAASQGASTLFVDSTHPTTVIAPTPALTTEHVVTLHWSAHGLHGATATSYDVRRFFAVYEPASAGWTYRSDGVVGGDDSAALKLGQGGEECVEVQTTDSSGDTGPWSAPTCVTRFLDDVTLHASGDWHRAKDPDDYRGTITATQTQSAVLTFDTDVTGATSIAVLASTCYDCGAVRVAVGGRSIGAVDLHSGGPQSQVVEPLTVPPGFSGPVTMTVRSTNRPVLIDGIAVTHGPSS
jgi:hypothetical protein